MEPSSKSPSAWFKSKLMCSDTRVRPLHGGTHHRNRSCGSRSGRSRRSSADYSYDPLSYALNFQSEDEFTEERQFSSRLPATPHREKNLDDLNCGIEAVEINGTGRVRDNNVFEATVPRVNTAVQSAEPPVETPTAVESGPERKLIVQAY